MAAKRIEVSAPGKVILHGEHSVMYGKTALAVGLGLRSTVIIEELHLTDNPQIHVKFPNVDLNETLPLKQILDTFPNGSSKLWMRPEELEHDSHLKLVDTVLSRTVKNFDELPGNRKSSLRVLLYALGGILFRSESKIADFSIKVTTELTIGAGTGSSASFAVSLCGAILQLVKSRTSGDVNDFSEDEKTIVSMWAFNCEKITHGTPSGIDNTTCTHGSLVSFKKGKNRFSYRARNSECC